MFGKAFVAFVALVHGQLAALPQKAGDAAGAATRPAAVAPAAPVAAKPVAAAPSAAQVVTGVQSYYAATQKFEATFRQKYTNTVIGKTSTSDGKVYIEKPGKMRWDYATPDVKYYISDGTTLWVYEKVNKQAFKQDLKDQLLPVAITFLYGQGDLSKDFTASLEPGKYGGKNDLVVKLVPNQPTAQYKFLWLVVDPTDFHVKESIIQEISGNLNSFAFSSIKTNAAAKYVGANLFKFVPPKGVKVVSPPAQMAQPGAPAAKGDSK